MREVVRQSSPIARVLLVLAAAFLLLTCVSLVKRAYRGDSDFGVFYRAAVSLSNGAGGELYRDRDEPTGWYNCIPPAGMVAFVGMAHLHRVAAGVAWAVANLGMLALAFGLLRRIYSHMGDRRIHYEATLPYALMALAVFGGVCLQTGQVSILFVVCWLGYVLSTTLGKRSVSGLVLAIPAAIKLYPIIFGIIPLLRKKWPEAGWGIVWIGILTIVLPGIFFGESAVELTTSFFKYQVLDPDGRMMTAADPTAVTNQGLDAVLLRYFSFVQGHSGVFRANVDSDSVLALSSVLRLAIIGVTGYLSLRLLRSQQEEPPFLLMALWCAALYMVLPGAKGRYAIYALPAILAMFAEAHHQFSKGLLSEGKRIVALSIVACALLLQSVPDFVLRLGIGYIGTVILWVFIIREVLKRSELSRRASENYATGGKRASDIF